MFKKSLIAITLVALLSVSLSAGEIKFHEWPGHQPEYVFDPVGFGPDIPVTMDIGYWAEIMDQEDLAIKLEQIEIHSYEGCTEVTIETNFEAELDCVVTPNGLILGDYTSTVDPSIIYPGTSVVNLCVQLENAQLGGLPGGTEDQLVATAQMTIIPVGL
jgi:hypothetical protein